MIDLRITNDAACRLDNLLETLKLIRGMPKTHPGRGVLLQSILASSPGIEEVANKLAAELDDMARAQALPPLPPTVTELKRPNPFAILGDK